VRGRRRLTADPLAGYRAQSIILRSSAPELSNNIIQKGLAKTSGDIRLDLDPLDLLRALAGVANIGLGPDGERAAKRLVDILIAGVRMRS
jgi:hypothetical protein